MEQFLEQVTAVNNAINSFVWVKIGLILLLGTGVIMTVALKFFQITRLPVWWGRTVGKMFSKTSHNKKESGSLSQFQSLCTALAATIGTGNIAGVSAAICAGGPGAVFWMWVAAFFGMMTNYAENVLGIYFRRRNAEGEWSGGPMYYLQDGLGGYKGMKIPGKILAVIFAIFAILASFGIGNMGQINKITLNLESAFFSKLNAPVLFGEVTVIHLAIGVILMIIAAVIIIGGVNRIANFAEKVVPVMALLYVIACLIICVMHIGEFGAIFSSIFRFAFGIRPIAGAVVGIAIKEVITQGCKRGVFSNEAGLGSSVMVHSNSNAKEPVKQGLWGIFEVFADTFIVCTMTAIVVLSSGAINLETGAIAEGVNDATLVAETFGKNFGPFGEYFVAIAMLLFAFTTVLGWSHYGSKAVEYLFGITATKVYKIIFTVMIISGAIMTSSLAWDISDTFNGLMIIPNLIGVLALTPLVVKITNSYIKRRVKNEDAEPVLSHFKEIEEEHAKIIKEQDVE